MEFLQERHKEKAKEFLQFEQYKEYFLEKYNVLPRFKAGAHIGKAIAGEIGIIKRDITYSGDLLNTTARIQGLCNEYKAFFLISADLREFLSRFAKNYIFILF